MKIHHYLYLIFLLFTLKNCPAQTQQVKFNLVSGSNGISLGRVNCITRDPQGVMWFSDQDQQCIIRYDGSEMIRYSYNPRNRNALGGPYPECIIADSTGIIWIGFNGMGLDRFDPETNTFSHFLHDPTDTSSLASDIVSALLVDHLGNLWIGNNGGLDLLNQKTGKFRHFKNNEHDSTSLSYNIVRAIYEDHEGTIWIGTGFPWADPEKNGGLNRFNRETGTFKRYLNDPKNPHSLINNKVRAIFEDSRGVFWVGTGGDGLHTMDRKTGSFERHTYNPKRPDQLSRPPVINDIGDHITFITEDALGYLWIGTFGNGVNRYDTSTKTITHFGGHADKSAAFKDKSCWWVNSSKDGQFWICTQEPNLYRIDLFTNNIPLHETNSGAVHAFIEENQNSLWIGTDSGLIRKNLQDGTSHRYLNEPLNPNSLSNNDVGTIIKDKQGDFWLGTLGGINQFNPNTGHFTRFQHDAKNSESLCSDYVYGIYEDSYSNFWVATDGGLDLMDRVTGKFVHYKYNKNDSNSISETMVTNILEQEPNVLWVGTYYGGINKMNPHLGKFKHYLPNANVTSIYKDADGTIWVGAANGLYRYNKKSDDFSFFGEGNTGFRINSVISIIGDDQNNLWISSPAGIYRINQKRDHIIIYDLKNGVEGFSSQFNGGVPAYKGHDGEIFFGTSIGYYAFYPNKLRITTNVPKVNLTNFWLKGLEIKDSRNGVLTEPLSSSKEILLKHDQNEFSIGFTAIDYSNPEDKKFYYKLENYDVDWRPSGPEARAYYFNVPPGKYIFRTRATNSTNGVWSEKEISIIISPPWWFTWWAYVFYSLLFIGLAYSIYRILKNRVIAAERERTRARELEHAKEIEKAYSELKLTQDQLIQSAKMASLGELTAGIAHEIQNPLNFINNFSEVNTELIDEASSAIDNGIPTDLKEFLGTIKNNQLKIIQHGQRADQIVKSMLLHSQISSGQKEATDINALANEYLRLSYQSFKAKDKDFIAKVHTHFDKNIEKIQVIPQNIGRALLNIYNNAFYVVEEKKRKQPNGFEPTVNVSTKRQHDMIEISIIDNGNGIPQNIRNKIFQPFFTTKPTGQGTGLGLSLSYDIIKVLGGKIEVKSKENEGSEFVIYLPMTLG